MLDDRLGTTDAQTQRAGEQPWQPQATTGRSEDQGSVGGTIRDLLETVIFILLVFFIVRGLIQNFRIDGQSMEPNLHNDQYILVNKVVYFHFDSTAPLRLFPGYGDTPQRVVYPIGMPERGDVVVLEAPTTEFDTTEKDYIKRVIGLPGEQLSVHDGSVFINGVQLDEPYLAPGQRTDCGTGALCESYTVPPDTVVVMGDNRGNSQDSRSWNAEPGLPLDRIVGRAWVSYWPQDRWGVIPTHTYAAPN